MSVHPPPRKLAATESDAERPDSSPSPVLRIPPTLPASAPPIDEAATLAPSEAAGSAAPGEVPSVPGYEIMAELGRGGMGVVYQARQTKLNRLVALKMILHASHASTSELVRFLAEGEAVAQLQHPNIVQIHEIGQQAGLPYFSLEYVEGGTLAQRLQGGPLPPREAARLAETLARAMAYAHGRGLIHRDLKPSNVLLAADGTPKITDFGLAKRLASPGRQPGEGLTATGAVLGHAQLHGPRAGRGQEGRHDPVRRVRPGRPALRNGHRPPAVPGPDAAGHDAAGHDRGAGAAVAAPARPVARPGDDLPQVSPERAAQALRLGPGAGRRPGTLPRRPADRGPSGEPARAHLALVPAQPGPGCPVRRGRPRRRRGRPAAQPGTDPDVSEPGTRRRGRTRPDGSARANREGRARADRAALEVVPRPGRGAAVQPPGGPAF